MWIYQAHGRQNRFCATTVDDCFFVTTNDEEWIKDKIKTLQDANEAVDVEQGDEFGLIGMHVKMDCLKKQVILTQPQFLGYLKECQVRL